MVNLINRDSVGRLSCLHALLISLDKRFNIADFSAKMAKHEVDGNHNPIDYCTCAKKYSKSTALVFGEERYCPFLKSVPSKAYCYLVNSNKLDSQKSKSAGLAIVALEALGLVNRKLTSLKRLDIAKVTAEGKRIAKYDFLDSRTQAFYKNQVVNYGPAVGFLHVVNTLNGKEIQHSEISSHMGRPENNDKVILSSKDEIKLHDGDGHDARTRTSGAIQAWLTYAGYLRPNEKCFDDFAQVDSFYCDRKNNPGYCRIFPDETKIEKFFSLKPLVTHPLSYDFYIKGGGTAREHSQKSASGRQLENLALKEFSSIVRNRRFLLMLTYAKASSINKGFNLRVLAKLSNFKGSPFVVDEHTHESIIIDTEADFLTIAGAPFIRNKENPEIGYPRVTLDVNAIAQENQSLAAKVERIISNKGIFV